MVRIKGRWLNTIPISLTTPLMLPSLWATSRSRGQFPRQADVEDGVGQVADQPPSLGGVLLGKLVHRIHERPQVLGRSCGAAIWPCGISAADAFDKIHDIIGTEIAHQHIMGDIVTDGNGYRCQAAQREGVPVFSRHLQRPGARLIIDSLLVGDPVHHPCLPAATCSYR